MNGVSLIFVQKSNTFVYIFKSNGFRLILTSLCSSFCTRPFEHSCIQAGYMCTLIPTPFFRCHSMVDRWNDFSIYASFLHFWLEMTFAKSTFFPNKFGTLMTDDVVDDAMVYWWRHHRTDVENNDVMVTHVMTFWWRHKDAVAWRDGWVIKRRYRHSDVIAWMTS